MKTVYLCKNMHRFEADPEDRECPECGEKGWSNHTQEVLYEGSQEIHDSEFPTMVDPGFFLEPHELYLYRNDANFWLGLLPYRDVAVQMKVGVENVFVDGERVDSSHFLDTMRRVEPDMDQMEGYVESGDPDKVAQIDIPFETWVHSSNLKIEKVRINRQMTPAVKAVHLSYYGDEGPIFEEATLNPFER